MSVEREIFGEWDGPGQQPSEGRLLVDKEGRITLQLRQPLPEGPLLRGRLSDGTPATLLSVNLLRLDPQAEHYIQELVIGMALLGLDLPDFDRPALAAGEARIGGLEQVIGTSGLTLQTSNITRRTKAFAKIEWQESKPIEIGLSGGILTLSDFARFEHESYYRFALEHRALARFTADEPTSLERVDAVFDVLAGFLAFATESRISFGSLSLIASKQDADSVKSEPVVAELLARRRLRYGPGPGEIEPWLTLGALSDPAGALAGFYRFHKEQPSAYLILFEYLVFASQLNPIDKLLYLARFLEVYHRTADPRKRDPEDIQEARAALVRGALGEEHKAWGAQLLHHSNEVTFKERVAELLAGPAVAALPILGTEPASFARLLGNTRNYWTHYSSEEELKALRNVALDEFDDRLLLVVRACVLDHIGVPAAEARRCLEADWRWQRRAPVAVERPE